MTSFSIRVIGDPVLKVRAKEVTEIDGRVATIAQGMVETLHRSDNGLALAAPQVGVQQRIFVHGLHDEPTTLINPEIRESSGESLYQEGCLSIPGLYFEIARPSEVLLVGRDLDGNEVQIEADGLEARMFQHEVDHLDGILMLEHLDEEQAREAKRALRELQLSQGSPSGNGIGLDLA